MSSGKTRGRCRVDEANVATAALNLAYCPYRCADCRPDRRAAGRSRQLCAGVEQRARSSSSTQASRSAAVTPTDRHHNLGPRRHAAPW